MRVEARLNQAPQDHPNVGSIDISLRGAPEPAVVVVPVDQIMIAVDGVQRYVVSHLSRIGRACRLLMETERSVSDVGFDSGFHNHSNFNRRFLALKRVSPREYRNRFRAGVQRS